METRALGDTGHESSIVTLGAIALSHVPQAEADALFERCLDAGVNHVDVAPTYGDAESKLAPSLERYRDDVFLGCKTLERDREGAREELEASRELMGVDRFDLYQFHAVTGEEAIDEITADGGALEAVEAAREEGVVDHVGVTSHGHPEVIREAIRRIEPATVMFPLNHVLDGKDGPKHDYASVLEFADERGVGTLGIKAVAKTSWPAESELPADERPYETWYEPFDTRERIAECVNYALSQGLTSVASAGDPDLLPMILDAGERYEELSEAEQAALRERGRSLEPPVPTS